MGEDFSSNINHKKSLLIMSLNKDSHTFSGINTVKMCSSSFRIMEKKGNYCGLFKAQKMLEKFGWRPGNGLGKEKQGITAALFVQKVDFRTAVIRTCTADCNKLGSR